MVSEVINLLINTNRHLPVQVTEKLSKKVVKFGIITDGSTSFVAASEWNNKRNS